MSDSLPISRRRDLGLGATLAAGVGLSACGEGGDKGGSATAKASQLNLDTLSGEITFQAQGLKGTFDGFFNDLIKKFEKEHSGCTIKWTDLPGTDDFDTTMVTQASNGTMADVVNMPSSTIMALSRADYLLDIETSMPGIGDKFVPDVWGKLKLGKDNEHTALPWYFGPFVVTYNKDIFKDVGLDPEIPPKTMTEYLDFAKKITAAGKQAVYGNTSWYMLAEWRALGVKVMNDDFTKFTFASESNALLWLTTMADMYAKGGISKDSIAGGLHRSKVYGEGSLAFGTPNASFLRNIQKNAAQAYARTGVGPEPLNDGIKPLFSGQYIAISKKTKNASLAAAFAEWITGVEQGKDAFAQARAICAKEATKAEAYMPDFYVTHGVSAALADNVNLAIMGDSKPQDALNTAQDKMNKMLAKLPW